MHSSYKHTVSRDDVHACVTAQKPPTNANIGNKATEEPHLKAQCLT